MHEFPHLYKVTASSNSQDPVSLSSEGLVPIVSTAPPEFDGPEGNWSPETLLVASVADCFMLTFKAIARASQFEWLELLCAAEGTLEKVERVTRFTQFRLTVTLRLADRSLAEKAERLLHMAEKNCLITNSLSAEVHLETTIR